MNDILRKPSIMTFARLTSPSMDSYANLIEQQEQRIAQLKKQLSAADKKATSLRFMTPGRMAKLKQEHQERVMAYVELELLEENIAQEKAKLISIQHKKPNKVNDNIKKGKRDGYLNAFLSSIRSFL